MRAPPCLYGRYASVVNYHFLLVYSITAITFNQKRVSKSKYVANYLNFFKISPNSRVFDFLTNCFTTLPQILGSSSFSFDIPMPMRLCLSSIIFRDFNCIVFLKEPSKHYQRITYYSILLRVKVFS